MTTPEEDEVEASRAPLIEHLIELRQRLIRALIAFVVMFLFCFAGAKYIYNVLVQPYVWAVGGADKAHMVYTHALEFFFTQIQVAVFGAGFLAFPVIANQLYKFVAPGLYRNERQAFLPFLVATPVLFAIGALVVYFIAMPLLMRFSVSMQQFGTLEGAPEIQFLPKVNEYLSLIMTLIFAFGICFQMPVILTLLARAGIIDSAFLKEKRRYAIVIVFVVAAVLTPPDVISQLALAIPTLLLYEASILSVRSVEKKRAAADAARTAAAE
jgi:sec-independent protein translocase protein TatC